MSCMSGMLVGRLMQAMQCLHQNRTSSMIKGLPRLAAVAMCACIQLVTKSMPETFQLSGCARQAAH